MRQNLHIALLLLVAGLMLATGATYAQDFGGKKKVAASIQAWQMRNDYGIADTVAVDTMPTNFSARNMLDDKSIAWAYNANLVSPSQSKIYFDRSGNGLLGKTGTGSDDWSRGGLQPVGSVRQKMDFLFGAAYEPYIITAQDVQYHRTTIAYSDISYKKTFKTYHEENDLHFSFTGNVNKRTNLGVELNYLTSPGRYNDQQGKVFNGYVNGSYDGTHYGLHAAIAFNNLSNFENGGLSDVSLLGGSLNAEDLPVQMQGMSGFSHISGFLDHHYSLTKQRDSTEIPMLTFNHVLEINNSKKRYVEKNANQHYFDDLFLNPTSTHDTANVLNIRNTLAVTLNEEFNRLMHFGVTAYVTNEAQRYLYSVGQRDSLIHDDKLLQSILTGHQMVPHLMSDTAIGGRWVNNTLVGASIYKKSGNYLHFDVNGDVCLVGYKLGEFQVNGQMTGTIPAGPNNLYIRAAAYVKNETPSWFVQHYRSNHYMWNNDFKKTYRFFVGGEVSYPYEWVKMRAKVGFENVTRYIYFDDKGHPIQMDGNIQVLSADLRADLTTPWINLENTVVYQLSSDAALPLPTLSIYHNLYYHGWWFKAMYAQMGVNLRLHTKYYAPLLNPATGQFCVQDQVEIGNYPDMNLYGNFYVKHLKLKFFVEWEHFSWLFMQKQQSHLHMPGYAMNPHTFRFGAAWHFWR